MIKCEITRHLNGVVKLIIIKEDDDTLIINMDKISYFSFSVRSNSVEPEFCLHINNDSDKHSKYYYFANKENYLKAKDFVERELLR